jgi:hypothetical protein
VVDVMVVVMTTTTIPMTPADAFQSLKIELKNTEKMQSRRCICKAWRGRERKPSEITSTT